MLRNTMALAFVLAAVAVFSTADAAFAKWVNEVAHQVQELTPLRVQSYVCQAAGCE